jgi:glycosyltransferase involved in cell wall biosynthesis
LALRKKVNAVLTRLSIEKQIIGLLSFWLNECAFVGKRFGLKNSIPHYCWMLGQDARKKNRYPQKMSIKDNELIALSDFLRDEFFHNHGIKPFVVIPPGIEVYPVNAAERDIDLFAAGSLIPLKQFEVFIEIVAYIRQQFPSVKAILAGDGPEKEKLQRLADQLGIEKNITFTGELPHPEVMTLMQRTKFFIHPSSYEGFGMVCLEALGSGANVISFCKVMEEDIEQWHIVNNKWQMKQKLLQLLQQSNVAYKQVDTFPIETTAREIMSLYHHAK